MGAALSQHTRGPDGPCYGAQARPNRYLATPIFGASQKGIVLLPQWLGLRLRFTGGRNGAFDAYQWG
jgi:hypothetical protein